MRYHPSMHDGICSSMGRIALHACRALKRRLQEKMRQDPALAQQHAAAAESL